MESASRIQFLTKSLELKEHPEGGYYREVYRSVEEISYNDDGGKFNGSRNWGTSIYFLLTSASFSAFHKINQDETWHFYEGSVIDLHVIAPSGAYEKVKIGSNLEKGEVFQFTVPGDHWFAAKVEKEESYALVGCTVAPGFDFEDFTLGKRDELVSQYPHHQKIIVELTR